MNYIYEGDETPEERLRNKLSVIFMLVEAGKCDKELTEKSIKVMPDILIHLDDIEEFYKQKYEKPNQCNCSCRLHK